MTTSHDGNAMAGGSSALDLSASTVGAGEARWPVGEDATPFAVTSP